MEIKKNIYGHLKDLKIIFARALIVFLIGFGILLYFAPLIFKKLIFLFKISEIKMIFTAAQGGFALQTSIAFNVALVLLMPYFWLETALYAKEAFKFKKGFAAAFGIAAFLYFASIAASLKFIIPAVLKFLLSFKEFGVNFYIDANLLISFAMQVLLAFAIVFEFPIILFGLIWANLSSIKTLAKYRRHAFVLSFIIGAILTPPDVVSQIIAALLIYAFFEGALLAAKLFLNKSPTFKDY
jgi:sec-independent protein translocase protein TatC